MRNLRTLVIFGSLTLLVGGLATPAHAATLIVTKTADTLDGSCSSTDCSLREAIQAANAADDLDTIFLPPGTYTITRDTILADDTNENGDLDILTPMAIVGYGTTDTVVHGNGAATSERVFDVLNAIGVGIFDLTVTGGDQAAGNGGGIQVFKSGPAGHADVALGRVAVVGNRSSDGAGGIQDNGDGPSVIFDSLIANNVAGGVGGGISVEGTGGLRIYNTTISGNTTVEAGGGMAIYEEAFIGWHLTITGNTANSDASGSEDGGGVWLNPVGQQILTNSIIGGNSVGAGGVGPDCSGSIESSGNNLVQDPTDCTGLVGSDATGVSPQLGPLRDNGGPTMTHGLLGGSPAINTAGDDGCLAADQRGAPRTGACDKGAYERVFCGRILVNRVGTEFDDVVRGTSGSDGFLGLDGNDRFFGLGGNDGACGGHGNDRLFGGAGRDRLVGQQDDDRLIGGKGIDRLVGGPGTDTCLGTIDREAGCER